MTRAKDISKIITDADFSGTLDVTGVSTLNSKVGILGTNDLGVGLHIKEGDSGVTSVSTDADQLVIENNAESGISILAPTNSASRIAFGDSDNNKIGMIYYNHSSNFMKFDVNNAERMRINSDGNVLIGRTSELNDFGDGRTSLVLQGTGSQDYSTIQLGNNGTASNTQILGLVAFYDGTENNARVQAIRATSTDSADLLFWTRPASGSLTERMRIDSSGNVGIGTSSPTALLTVQTSTNPFVSCKDGTNFFNSGVISSNYGVINSSLPISFQISDSEKMRINSSGQVLVNKTSTGAFVDGVLLSSGGNNFSRDSNTVIDVHRGGSDGNIIAFYAQSTFEGSISVSGTTISYNGGHLARWSRLLDNSKDTTIVKGTVMTNLDEMVEWDGEDNEQLNKMAVSSVEGDANVAGVFVNWDNDDDWNDMNVAMTGDMVIRIAQGTTVSRGDLLMSAGDGTAKPQDDDIVRSKTIAKVTSTNVSHTYDDGTYLVPCVLMAC